MEEDRMNYWMKRQLTRRRVLRAGVLGGAGLAAASLIGCGTTQSPRSDTTPTGSSGGAKTIDKVTIGVGEEPPSFDSHKATGAAWNYVTKNLYEGLIAKDLKGKLIPSLATSWTMAPDGKSYEFKLRQGVKFHNGDPLTAKDVEFSWKRLKDPKVQPKQSTMANWESIEVVDDYTVKTYLKQPDPSYLGYVSYDYRFQILPKNYFEKVGDDAFEKAPIGTGPYKFVRRAVKEFWELEAFADWWGGPLAVKHAVFKVIPESTTLAGVLKTGEVDFVDGYPPMFVEDILKSPGFKVIRNKADKEVDVRINTKKETDPDTGKPNPYRDRRVRMAMQLSVDTNAIIKNLTKGSGEPVAVLFPEDVGYDPDLKPYPYDPKKAKELLAEAGYPNGFDATFWGLLGERIPQSKEVGEAVANYFTAIGIRTKVVNEEYAAWLSRTSPSTGDLWPFGFGPTFAGGMFHPIYGFETYAGCKGTTSWYCNPDLDAIVAQMYKTTDPAQVEQLVKKAAKLVYDEVPVVILYRYVIAYAMKDSLDFTATPNSQYTELVNLKPK